MSAQDKQEKLITTPTSGMVGVVAIIILLAAAGWNIFTNLYTDDHVVNAEGIFIRGIITAVLFVILIATFVTQQRNEATVFTFMGEYVGTLKGAGFFCVPFWWGAHSRRSLAIKSASIGPLSVNDKDGKPIIIACDVFFQEKDTALATFEPDNLDKYLVSKAEIAIRNIAKNHPMDVYVAAAAPGAVLAAPAAGVGISLMKSQAEVTTELENEISNEFAKVGYVLDKAAIKELRYSPEMAPQMLQRQNAQATVEARDTLTAGALGIVDNAIKHFADKDIVMTPEQKVTFGTNLLITLVSQHPVTPVLQVGGGS